MKDQDDGQFVGISLTCSNPPREAPCPLDLHSFPNVKDVTMSNASRKHKTVLGGTSKTLKKALPKGSKSCARQKHIHDCAEIGDVDAARKILGEDNLLLAYVPHSRA